MNSLYVVAGIALGWIVLTAAVGAYLYWKGPGR